MDVMKLMLVGLAGWSYHRGRNYQGLENRIIRPDFSLDGEGEVQCRERLGGLLLHCYRDAAWNRRSEFPDTTGVVFTLAGDSPAEKLPPAFVSRYDW